MLGTVLVCPLKGLDAKTSLRPVVQLRDLSESGEERWVHKVVLCELVRPISRSALTPLGELDAADSRRVMSAFRSILAG
jgi:mRNA-degrading endonuclease toxin of MazEF toxin-antitoxin module